MSLGEFELIRRHFDRPVRRSPLGIGDDCALLAPRPGMQLAVSSDMLVEGRHFLSTTPPEALGHKALAVNLSDLAACGAEPLAFTLALALPQADERWLAGFTSGLFALADAHGIELVGGDTTRGPLNLCITVFGEVPAGSALLRSGAQPGDELWVSGCPGLARLWLEVIAGRLTLDAEDFAQTRRAMEWPQPRVALGQALRGLASSAIDLSDGLLGDLAHVLQRSTAARCGDGGLGLGAEIDAETLPRHPVLDRQPPARRLPCQLAGGDDYELLFTAAPQHHAAVRAAGLATGVPLSCIGRIVARPGVRVLDAEDRPIDASWASHDHFG